ncbi:MAG TPA: hypothetical protein PLI09_11710 [Candidatus Hydrogenedentes bacterium]|nr:hypothetical protein [Candidatus Hydrogenedentota bacterium]
MKSAYEIALERLAKESGPQKSLTPDQKARIAEIENKYAAKVAEARLRYESKLSTATTWEEAEQFKREMAGEVQSLEEKCDQEKDAVWEET